MAKRPGRGFDLLLELDKAHFEINRLGSRIPGFDCHDFEPHATLTLQNFGYAMDAIPEAGFPDLARCRLAVVDQDLHRDFRQIVVTGMRRGVRQNSRF